MHHPVKMILIFQRYLVYCQRIPEYDIMEVPYD